MKPSITSFRIGDLMRSLRSFAPVARAKARLTVPSSLPVGSDRLMLQLLQNLISMRQYTPHGRV